MISRFKTFSKVFNSGPPDLLEILSRFLEKIRKIIQFILEDKTENFQRPNLNNAGSFMYRTRHVKKILLSFLSLLFLLWFLSGIYVVQPAQQAVTLIFGKFHSVQEPGLHWKPSVVSTVIKKDVELLNTIRLNKQMLTSEENMVNISFSVQYRIENLKAYLFSTNNPELILKQSLESAVRQIVGENKLEKILTVSRTQITHAVQSELEKLLSKYSVGIHVNEVIMQPAQAPYEVKSAFDDVIKAREDKERIQNEAHSYANKVIPLAKGRAQRILDEARAYESKVVLESQGNVASFNELLLVYEMNKDVVESQLYYQTMEDILKNNKVYLVEGDGMKNIFYGDKVPAVLSSSAL